MKIIILSDTHRYAYIFDKLKNIIKDADVLIHLGDNVQDVEVLTDGFEGQVFNVRGNCDYNTRVSSEKIIELEEKIIFITHGHNYGVKNSLLNLKTKALEIGANIVLYGHTHISEIVYDEGIWIVNPGSPSLSRDGYNSYAVITIENGKICPSIKSL
jgi:putative phosphoesterase